MKLETYTLREHIVQIPIPQSFFDIVELVSSDHYRRGERKLRWGGGNCETSKRRFISLV